VEELLELVHALLFDVDEVQLPRIDGSRTLHLHKRCHRVSGVDQEHVLARRDADEDHERDDEENDDRAHDAPGFEVASQNRNRFSPPSTTTVCPVT
jgi:hypothetical protein